MFEKIEILRCPITVNAKNHQFNNLRIFVFQKEPKKKKYSLQLVFLNIFQKHACKTSKKYNHFSKKLHLNIEAKKLITNIHEDVARR